MKKIIAILAVVLMMTVLLTACGDKNEDAATADSATPDEIPITITTLVEKTEDGGTIEKDTDDNVITFDKTGEIVSITDDRGNEVVITEYLTTHYIVASNGMTYGNPDAQSASSKSSGSSQSGASSKSSGGSSSSSSEKDQPASSSKEEKQESSSSKEEKKDVPATEFEISEGMDEYELPLI